MLSLSGHEVETAFRGKEAVAIATAVEPDVILLDIGLPDIDGWEVARQLRDRPWRRRPLVVAITAYGTEEDRTRSREAGIDHHLVKPADLGQLSKIMDDRARVQSE